VDWPSRLQRAQDWFSFENMYPDLGLTEKDAGSASVMLMIPPLGDLIVVLSA